MSGQTIAVAVAGTESSWPALAWAIGEASLTGGRLQVCHVCPPDSVLAEPQPCGPATALALADHAIAQGLAVARTRLGEARVQVAIETGHVGAALVDLARIADLLVVGAPRLPGWAERGSTTHYLVHRASCPVVVLAPGPAPPVGPFGGHIVIGVDGSGPSRAALEFGFGYAAAHRRPVAVVHVTGRDEPDTGPSPDLDLFAGEVDPWRDKYPEVPLTSAVLGGPVLPGLLRAASGARLLVLGDRGRGPAIRAVLGSVSHGAVDRATCPLAITHTRR